MDHISMPYRINPKFNTRVSGIPYSALSENEHEICLLSFVPERRESSLIHCRLLTVSLKSYTSTYKTYLSSLSLNLTKRKVIKDWARIHSRADCTAGLEQDDLNDSVPMSHALRYDWGDYAALSYVCDDGNLSSPIVIDGFEIYVTQNLEAALRTLRRRSDFENRFKLWVDALCINQSDYEERENQVKRMRNIYGNAWTVIAWLGKEEDGSLKAFDPMKALSTTSREGPSIELKEKLIAEPNYLGTGSWVVLHELMQRPYWTRLWIIQEIVLGSSGVLIRCGNNFISWPSFCAGIQVLFNHLWTMKEALLARDAVLCKSLLNGRWKTPSLYLIHKDLMGLSRYEEEGGDRLSFGRLLDIANTAMARDTRDKVYGLFGLMHPRIAGHLVPNYRIDPSHTFAAAAKLFILNYNNLDPLREGNLWSTTETPSWVADWSWESRLPYSRPECPPFWTLYNEIRDTVRSLPYLASGNTLPVISFSGDGLRLTCRGLLIDKIAGLSARGLGFYQWLEKSIIQSDSNKSIYGDTVNTSEALYRALLADRVWNGESANDRHAVLLSLPSTFQVAEPQFRQRGWKRIVELKDNYYR